MSEGLTNRGQRLIALARERAGNEAQLFRLYLDVEDDPGLDAETRARVLDQIGTLVDELRRRRGLGDQPTVEQLLEHYDGAPPAPVDELREAYPSARVESAMRCELVGGRMRVFPIVTVELGGQHLDLYPEPAAQARRSRR